MSVQPASDLNDPVLDFCGLGAGFGRGPGEDSVLGVGLAGGRVVQTSLPVMLSGIDSVPMIRWAWSISEPVITPESLLRRKQVSFATS